MERTDYSILTKNSLVDKPSSYFTLSNDVKVAVDTTARMVNLDFSYGNLLLFRFYYFISSDNIHVDDRIGNQLIRVSHGVLEPVIKFHCDLSWDEFEQVYVSTMALYFALVDTVIAEHNERVEFGKTVNSVLIKDLLR